MRKILSVLVGFLCLFGLFSCGQGRTEQSSDSEYSKDNNQLFSDDLEGAIEKDGKIIGGYLRSSDREGGPLPATIMACKIDQSVAATEETVSIWIAASELGFDLSTPSKDQENVFEVKITVSNPKNSAEILLGTISSEAFTQENYGYTLGETVKGSARWIEYKRFDEYSIPTTFLTGIKGELVVNVEKDTSGSKESAFATICYEYSEGTIYFKDIIWIKG